jgi:hypothetical protein
LQTFFKTNIAHRYGRDYAQYGIYSLPTSRQYNEVVMAAQNLNTFIIPKKTILDHNSNSQIAIKKTKVSLNIQ